jgi:hypothetical protein
VHLVSTHAHLVPPYRRLRKISVGLNQKLVESLSKDVMEEGAQKLGFWHKVQLVLGAEDELSVLMDYCICNVYRKAQNAVQRKLAEAPPSDPEERALLEAQANARYSLFQVAAVEKGVGVSLVDALRKDEVFVVDVGFGTSARRGLGFAGRIIPLDGYFIADSRGGGKLPN